MNTTITRGEQQIGMLNLPTHGDIIECSGRQWTVKMNGGFMLRNGIECHPNFINGPKSAIEFATWFNDAF